jgi:hypothetical protein
VLGRAAGGTRLVPALVTCGLAGLWGWLTGSGLPCRVFGTTVHVSSAVWAKASQVPAAHTGIAGTHWVTVGEVFSPMPLRMDQKSPVAEENTS